ncbi:phosphotransferase [Marinicella litoralis]|uniref:Aminoglycoside phosphotransferase (APT) family kinase protein n=1 Tax=Marinicella litoralis TaxID=644220 RepID=A0A4R6XLZ0_9GAMM|nr:phosphotransferase [Marinicella litoralis]TDR20655.1 aminoglycoside phosphotransferase (APT) family kinase protein [Marinicella litoralis]
MQPNWLRQITQIPTIQQAGLLGCERITGGISNLNFKVTTHQGIWVVRLNQAQLGVNRKLEQDILNLIAPLKLSPEVIDANPAAGYLITAYCDLATWRQSNTTDVGAFTKLADSLNALHQIPCHHSASRLDQRITHYLKQINHIPDDLAAETMHQIDQLEQLGFWSACQSLYHSDLNPNNLLGNDQAVIIDWEFAGQGHALLDWLIMEQEHQQDLSQFYPTDIRESWLPPSKALIANLMKLWDFNLQQTNKNR